MNQYQYPPYPGQGLPPQPQPQFQPQPQTQPVYGWQEAQPNPQWAAAPNPAAVYPGYYSQPAAFSPSQPPAYPSPAQYAQPVYAPPAQYVQPVYAPPAYPQGSYPPPFALRQDKNPAVTQASKVLNRLCLVLLLQSAAAMVIGFIIAAVSVTRQVDFLSSDIAFQWLETGLVPLSTALPFLIYLMIGKKDVTEYLRFEKVGFLTALLCVLGGLAICLLGNYPAFAIQDFFGQFGYEPTSSISQTNQSIPMFVLEMLSTAVLVPVMEEFAFRGVMLSALRRYGAGFAIFGSALVFAFAHAEFSNVVFAFTAGLVFGFLYVKTGNLWISIWIHALNNGIAVVESYSGFLFGESLGNVITNATMLVPVAVGVLALLLLLIFKRSMLFRKNEPGAVCTLSGSEAALAIVRAPLFWVVFSFVVLYTAQLFF